MSSRSDETGTPDESVALGASFVRAGQTVQRLVAVDGCAWHGVQTHRSLTQYLVEEAAEVVDAIDRDVPVPEMVSELADLLYQVLFHAAIAERDAEGYTITDVADQLHEKLVARHPHVFGDRGYMTVAELDAEWEQLKEDAVGQERGSRGVLDGIPHGMPTLAKSAKFVKRVHHAGLDAQLSEPVVVTPRGGLSPAAAAVGADLLNTVRRAADQGIDADMALRLTLAAYAQQTVGDAGSQGMKE